MIMLASPSADAMSFSEWKKRDFPLELKKLSESKKILDEMSYYKSEKNRSIFDFDDK